MKASWPWLAAVFLAVLAAPAGAQQWPPSGGFGGQRSGAPAQEIRPVMPWIDAHFHLVPDRHQGGMDFSGSIAAALRDMDKAGIALAVVLPPPQVESQRAPYDHHSYAAALKRYPGRFAFLGGGTTLNAAIHKQPDPAKVTDKARRDFTAAAESILNAGAAGFGEIAVLHLSATQGHPFEQVPADHPLLLALAEVAGRRGVPIDLHLDAVAAAGAAPPQHYAVPPNPPRLRENIAAFERLLAHDRRARIVWAHGGSDPLGAQTPALVGQLMDRHPNLYMSLRLAPEFGRAANKVMAAGRIEPVWLELLQRHPGRFVMGTDTFSVGPDNRGGGPATVFAQRNGPKLAQHVRLLAMLPIELAKKLAEENPRAIYGLKGP